MRAFLLGFMESSYKGMDGAHAARQRNLPCHFVHTLAAPVEEMTLSEMAANLKVHCSGHVI